jgi:hypothetical protein
MVNPIVFVCVGREDGCTKELVATALEGCPYTLIDLGTKNFSDHDPKGQNSGDDFLHMAEQMVQHNPIILACPVSGYCEAIRRSVGRLIGWPKRHCAEAPREKNVCYCSLRDLSRWYCRLRRTPQKYSQLYVHAL